MIVNVLKLEFDNEIKQTHERGRQVERYFYLKAYDADVYESESEFVVAALDFFFIFFAGSVLAHPN